MEKEAKDSLQDIEARSKHNLIQYLLKKKLIFKLFKKKFLSN